MTLLAIRDRLSDAVSSRQLWPPSWRLAAGIVTATTLLSLVTIMIHADGLSRFGKPAYLAAVIVAALIGGRWVAWLTVPAATLLMDYYLTEPIYVITPWRVDTLVFIVLASVVAALAVIASRRAGRHEAEPSSDVINVTTAMDAAFRRYADAKTWAAVYCTRDDEQFALWPPHQDCDITAQQLAAGLRKLNDEASRASVV